MLRKIKTQHVRSCAQAAMAESGDLQMETRMAQVMSYFRDPTAEFYKIENETGAFVGFFISDTTGLLTYHLRPQFQVDMSQLNALVEETRYEQYRASLGAYSFVTLNML